jgi:hypothetical protein
MKYLLILLILSGCGKGPNNIDPAFQPLYDNFVADANVMGVDVSGNKGITVEFATLEQATSLGEEVGECDNPGWGNNTVKIDTSFWNNASSTYRFFLLYHELGHCLLDEGHLTDPKSIMYPILNTSADQYQDSSRLILLNQLFSNRGDL